MSDPAVIPWTIDQFFAWQARQPVRYELVNGFPVRMTAGARNVHDAIVVNLIAELHLRLRGTGCRPFTGDSSIETLPGQIRRPDAGVDCGQRNPDDMKAALPRLVAEVLSPSTRDFDTFGKLDEYKQVDSLETIIVIEPNAPEVVVWSRGADRNWVHQVHEGIDQFSGGPRDRDHAATGGALRRRGISSAASAGGARERGGSTRGVG